jgi:hypothetical protein
MGFLLTLGNGPFWLDAVRPFGVLCSASAAGEDEA